MKGLQMQIFISRDASHGVTCFCCRSCFSNRMIAEVTV
jgi:hypothetical protein